MNYLENRDKPAFPMLVEGSTHASLKGLTKREYFAAVALQGLLAWTGSDTLSPKDLAGEAVNYADLLLARLGGKQ